MIAIDTHVHLYPAVHNLDRALAGLAARLHARVPGATAVACLAERAGQNVFEELWEGRRPSAWLRTRYHRPDAERVLNMATSGGELWIVPGRQVVSQEGLEVLLLGHAGGSEDGRPAEAVIAAGRAAGAVPVLAWAAGKWWGRRGRDVARLAANDPELLLGDASMRPVGWPQPPVMAARPGRVAAGSDPLPFRGDAAAMGRYASRIDATLDPRRPWAAIRAALTSGRLASVGRRNTIPRAAYRWLRCRTAKVG